VVQDQAKEEMSQPLPAPRQMPVVPRPRHGELLASYLARVARVNRTQWRTFAGLLGRLPSGLPRNPDHLALTIVTLNEAAFARLLAYTGHDADRLIRTIPSLAPATFARPGEPPALRVASLNEQVVDCPQCCLRRDSAFIDTRLFPLKMTCLRHGYWLFGDGAGRPLDHAVLPEITTAQKRLNRLAARRGTAAAVHAYGIAHSWLPTWAIHPECTALAVMFASPHWAELAVPSPDCRHRLVYQHLLSVLGASRTVGRVPSVRNFDPLPQEIREQASWGGLLSDPEWGSPIESREGPRKIPFIDITDAYERSYLETPPLLRAASGLSDKRRRSATACRGLLDTDGFRPRLHHAGRRWYLHRHGSEGEGTEPRRVR
jgi:TniQ